MSRKSERLVNLTIALLTSKRLLTKAEIYKKVEGYDGDPDARDRMFERDKDELRSIGIIIEVGQIDAFFEDEVGYRITQSAYALNLEKLTPQELTLIALAQQFFSGHALGDSAQGALIKLKSSGVPVDESLLSESNLYQLKIPTTVTDIIRAIAEKRLITFEYVNEELESQSRTIAPFHLTYSFNKWYFKGLDQSLQELRTFRLDRLNSEFTLSRKSELFTIPIQTDTKIGVEDQLKSVVLDLAEGFRPTWLKDAQQLGIKDGWTTFSASLPSTDETVSLILRAGNKVKVLGPADLRSRVIDALAQVVTRHG